MLLRESTSVMDLDLTQNFAKITLDFVLTGVWINETNQKELPSLRSPLQWWEKKKKKKTLAASVLAAASCISLSLLIFGKLLVSFCSFHLRIAKYSLGGLASGDGKKKTKTKKTRVDMQWNVETVILQLQHLDYGFNWVNFQFLTRCHFHFCSRKRHQGHGSAAECAPLSNSPSASGIDLAIPN